MWRFDMRSLLCEMLPSEIICTRNKLCSAEIIPILTSDAYVYTYGFPSGSGCSPNIVIIVLDLTAINFL
ncbi:hypothetical protein H6G35_08670 [Aulosira sp. FACHB-113]|nr:hypothetical protein [Aulosira sp. FACHB-113]